MSEVRVSETLQSMGFSDTETKIYLYLSKKGQQKGRALALALKINKQQLYPSLKNLQSKGIVSQTLEHPAGFNALPFDRVLDLYLKTKLEEVRRIEQSKDQILSDWQSIVVNAAEGQSDRFMVFEGRTRIFSMLEKMIQESKKNLQAIASVNGLRQVDAAGVFETARTYLGKSQVKFNLLMDINGSDEELAKKVLKEISQGQKNLQVKSPILPLKTFPTLLMRDNEEILLFIKPLGETNDLGKNDVCLWTNCKTIIDAFQVIFQDLWRNSTHANKFNDLLQDNGAKVTYQSPKQFAEKIAKAEQEVFILTSSQGLLDLQKDANKFDQLKKEGVITKVLAPIDHKNSEIANLLSNYATVKHIPANSVQVTIIDNKYLYQSQNESTNKTNSPSLLYSQSAEYIKRMKETLEERWKTAQEPSNVTLESISGPYGYNPFPFSDSVQIPKIDCRKNDYFKLLNVKPLAAITEKEILNKILSGKKYAITKTNKVNVMYASAASAIIHPPQHFNLPRMLINVNHIEKKSSLGEADVLEVHLWLDTPKGPCFVSMGGLGDNAQGVLQRRAMFAGTPFEKNHQLVNKDQLEVRVYGNTLFAGWTVPIKLSPWKHTLPPGCILFEGYGNVKSSSISVINPIGVKVDREQNWFDAYVTFMHPASKYSGPGTDGLFARDLIVTMTPP